MVTRRALFLCQRSDAEATIGALPEDFINGVFNIFVTSQHRCAPVDVESYRHAYVRYSRLSEDIKSSRPEFANVLGQLESVFDGDRAILRHNGMMGEWQFTQSPRDRMVEIFSAFMKECPDLLLRQNRGPEKFREIVREEQVRNQMGHSGVGSVSNPKPFPG